MSTERELRAHLVDVSRVLFRLHLVDDMGHCSARIPGTDHALIKPRHSLHVGAQDRHLASAGKSAGPTTASSPAATTLSNRAEEGRAARIAALAPLCSQK